MQTEPLKLFNTLCNYGDTLAKYYSLQLANKMKEGNLPSTLILIKNYTPTFLIGFASWFDNVRIILDRHYDYESDPLFDIPNTDDFEIEASRAKAIYYKARELQMVLEVGGVVDLQMLRVAQSDYERDRITVVKYERPIALAKYLTSLRGFPALVIDATIFEDKIRLDTTEKNYTIARFDKKPALNLSFEDFMGDLDRNNETFYKTKKLRNKKQLEASKVFTNVSKVKKRGSTFDRYNSSFDSSSDNE